MEENITYSIRLSDGSAIENLSKNGDNFISHIQVKHSDFLDKTSPVQIIGSDGSEEEHDNMELVQIQKHGNEYWIVLADIPEEKMEKIKMQSDIEYLAMMAGIEL